VIRYFWFVLVVASFAAQSQSRGYSLAVDTGDKAPDKSQLSGYVFDITVQNTTQLNALFQRADRLRGQFSPNEHGRIALVLHGEELRLFQKSNYKQFMEIVDQARQLDSQNLIDIKACQTAMELYKIDKSDLPDFIEQVPFAPIEIERLQKEKGYTRL
jgi:intracellular sulfur oxidation DsrE/DsrF family protein